MGQADGKKGVWAYIEGGMGAVSNAIASSACEHGAEILTNASVNSILLGNNSQVTGVNVDGSILEADIVISGATPYHTMVDLITPYHPTALPKTYLEHIMNTDYTCGAFKINLVVDRLPNFTCYPSPVDGQPGPMHRGIHKHTVLVYTQYHLRYNMLYVTCICYVLSRHGTL